MKFTLLLVALCAAENPIGQVLSLLTKLQNTVITDGETEQKQYEFCAGWCEDQAKQRQYEVKTGKAQVEDLNAAIEKAAADIEATNAKIGDVSQKIATNEADLKAATKVRNDENGSFAKEEKELVETVDTLRRAQSVLSRHLQGGAFVQTDAMEQFASSMSVILQGHIFSAHDKNAVQAFLQQQEDGVNAPEAAAYESHSRGILDTLADMQDKAEGMLADARKAEMVSQHNFELLRQSLQDELKVQNDAMSNAKKHLGAVSEVKGTAEGDRAATQAALDVDEKYLKDLSAICQQKAVNWEASTKSRDEELKALAEAKRIIQEATGGASGRQYKLIQLSAVDDSTTLSVYDKVKDAVKRLGRQTTDTSLTQLAARIAAASTMSTDPFAKVKGLIEDMLARLVQEAQEDASHKAFCDKETAESEAKRDKSQATVAKLTTRIEKATASVAKLKQDIANLQEDLTSIAKSQRDMDAMRESEHSEFVKSEADFKQGLDGVRYALKVLREYYSKQGASAALVQQQWAGTHSASTDSASGIIGLLEVAESDFARSLAEARANEEDSQNEYDTTTQDNRELTASKKAATSGKQDEVGRLEQAIADADADRAGVNDELNAVLEYLEKLRPQCTTQPESYEERKKRREAEIDGLKQALDILENETAGAGDAFLSLRRIQRHL